MAGPSAGTTTAIVMGGFLCLGLVFLGIAATIVLSLIPTFTSNHAEEGYGDEYAFDAVLLKMLYTDSTNTSFNYSAVASSADLSTACTSQVISSGATGVSGCVMQNGYAFGPYNNVSNTTRRRRREGNLGAYFIYNTSLFFSTRCPKKADQNKTIGSSGLSYCVEKRLQQCNSLINYTSTSQRTGSKRWSSSLASPLSILGNSNKGYTSITVSGINGFAPDSALAAANSLGLPNGTKSAISYGCRYVGPISHADIANAIAGQTTVTTTASTTQAVG